MIPCAPTHCPSWHNTNAEDDGRKPESHASCTRIWPFVLGIQCPPMGFGGNDVQVLDGDELWHAAVEVVHCLVFKHVIAAV